MTQPIRVHVATEQRVLQEVIAGALSKEPGISLVGVSAGCHDIAPAGRPDVVVLCHGWRETGETVTRCREKVPGAKVVLMLLGGEPDEGREAGADYVVEPGDGLAALAAAVRAVGS